MAEQKNRIRFIDMIKGIAILFIVFYHTTAPSAIRDVLVGMVFPSVSAFFVLSGYFYTPGKHSLKYNIVNRTKELMIPFFKYSLCFWAIGTVCHLIKKTATLLEALYCLRNFYIGCIWNRVIQDWFSLEYYSLGKRYMFLADFWFLIALMFASILFFLIADKVLKSAWKETLAITALIAISGILRGFEVSLPYNLQLVPFWTACMFLGAVAKERDAFDLPFMKGAKGWIISLAAIAAGASVSAVFRFGLNVFRGTFDPVEPVTMIAMLLCGIAVLWGLGNLCRLLEQTGMRVKELAWLGSHSLYIYLFHMMYAWLISIITGFSVIYKDEVTGETLAISLLIGIASIALSVLTALAADALSAKIKKHRGAAKKTE
ncbi:MAG: acyltransferase [Ruminiclostridium sp.]|nr:acyltransferase [Ruminiclostridium sp.]